MNNVVENFLKYKKQIIITSSVILVIALAIVISILAINKNAKPISEIGEVSKIEEEPSSTYISSIEAPESSENHDNDSDNDQQIIDVDSLKLNVSEISIYIGQNQMPIVSMFPTNATDKSEIWSSSNESIASVDNMGNIKGISEGECIITVSSKSNPSVSATVSVAVKERPAETQSKSQLQSTAPNLTYINGILIVNKTYPLPSNYNPGVDQTALSAFNNMKSAAANEGLNIYIASGFRSYSSQVQIYNNFVNSYGQSSADTFSARPGHSEHQSGLCFDLNSIDDSFAYTPESSWVNQNAHKYGFIIRYPKGKDSITGYQYEPWHIRYLGVDLATSVYNSGLCLEEYLGITSSYS